MLQLPQVTLITLSTRDIEQATKALEYSYREIQFSQVKLISPYKPINLPEYILWEHIEPFPVIDDWNEYIVYDLWKHFNTSHCLLIHSDGFVVNSESWKDEWLNFDYIGSPWGIQCALAIQGGRDQPLSRVGNSVGIRSHRLCKLPSDAGIEWRRFNNDSNEDTFISAHNKRIFEACGMRFSPLEVAIEFGREEDIPECQHIDKPFCFHKWEGRNSQYPRF